MRLSEYFMCKCAGVAQDMAAMIVGGGIGAANATNTEKAIDNAALGALMGLGVSRAMKILHRDKTERGLNPQDVQRLRNIYAKRQ